MSARVGRLQGHVLEVVQAHAGEISLARVVYVVAGLADPDDVLFWRKPQKPSASAYSSTARAVSSLVERGLLRKRLLGLKNLKPVFDRDEGNAPGSRYRFIGPTSRLLVSLPVVETLTPGGQEP